LLGLGALETGLAFLPVPAMSAVFSLFVAARVVARFGARAVLATGFSFLAVGMVLLAYAPMEILDDLLSGPLPSFTRRTCTDPHELRRVLADVRRKGYAYSDRQISNEFVSVASPIYGADGGVVAALSLIVPFAEAKGPAHGHLVQSSARAISRALGANLSTPRSSRALHESG
jgi:DNA-binding IclR family transcriptional regulator